MLGYSSLLHFLQRKTNERNKLPKIVPRYRTSVAEIGSLLLSVVEFSMFLQSTIHERDCTKKSCV